MVLEVEAVSSWKSRSLLPVCWNEMFLSPEGMLKVGDCPVGDGGRAAIQLRFGHREAGYLMEYGREEYDLCEGEVVLLVNSSSRSVESSG